MGELQPPFRILLLGNTSSLSIASPGEAQRSGFGGKKEEPWSGQSKNQSKDWFLQRERNAL